MMLISNACKFELRAKPQDSYPRQQKLPFDFPNDYFDILEEVTSIESDNILDIQYNNKDKLTRKVASG